MAINPIAFARAVNEPFLRYQLTAFPLTDEALKSAGRLRDVANLYNWPRIHPPHPS